MTIQHETKPGLHTTEFWVTLITLILTNVNALPIPDRFQGWVNVILPSVYAVARGLAKSGNPEVTVPVGGTDPSEIQADQGDAGKP